MNRADPSRAAFIVVGNTEGNFSLRRAIPPVTKGAAKEVPLLLYDASVILV